MSRSRVSGVWLLAPALFLLITVATAGGAAPRRPSPQALQRVQAAGQALLEAQQLRNADSGPARGKEGANYLQRALENYNAARAGAFGAPVDPYAATGSFDGALPEVEPNETAGAAQSLDAVILREGSAVVAGEIRGVADMDVFSFTVGAGARVWACLDTGGVQLPGGTSRDSILELFNTDGTTVIESDDDDAVGNGRDATAESVQASVIAGRALPGAGTYYLRAREFQNDQILAPYRLYVVITTEAGGAETEPNETIAAASTLLPVGAQLGIMNGSATGVDKDHYRLALQAGDVISLQLDEDPTRDADPSRDELALLDPDGALLLSATNDSGSGTSHGSGFSWRAATSGIYFVRVSQSTVATDTDYTVMARVHTRSVGHVSVINGALGGGSEDYPAISGSQISRLFRDGVPSNCNNPPKPFPGILNPGALHSFDAYQFKNRSGVAACVTVALTAHDSSTPFSSTYSTFDPGNLASGYLADMGNSSLISTTRAYSLLVEPGAVFVVLVAAINPGVSGSPYTLTVTGDLRSSLVGCPANITVANDPNLAGAVVNYNAPGVTDPSLGPVVCAPASGSFFPIGDTLVTCRDSIGTTCSFTVTVKDVQPPTVNCPSPITVNLNQPAGAVVNYMASATDNAPGVNLVCAPASGTVFPLGLTVVTCTATDAAGNVQSCTFPVTVKDTVAPVITCPDSVVVNQTQANGALVTYAASATDNSGAVNFSASPASGTLFPLGGSIVTCTATDASGNVAVRTFIVTVKDTQGPVVTCPASVNAVQDQAGGAVVSYVVSSNDNGGSVNLTCSPASGSFFALGTTTVTCVAADTSGNVSTCSFPVTVSAPASTAGVKVGGSGSIATGSVPAKFKITGSVSPTGVPKLAYTHTQSKAVQALKSVSVTAINRNGNLVRIFGTIRNGKTGPIQQFMLEVRDVAKPGANQDTYRLDVRGGFQLAQTVISTGDIAIKP